MSREAAAGGIGADAGLARAEPVKAGGKTLRMERVYRHPPEAVWQALTDPRALAEWAFPNDFRPEAGRDFRFQVDPMGPYSGLMECRVLEIDPPRRMVWSWVNVPKKPGATRPAPMRLTWTITPEAAGSRLTLVQEGMEVMSFLDRISMRFGWGTMLGRWLPRIVEEGVRREGDAWVFTPGVIPLEKRCYKARTIPEHLAR
jgi:uncharacterized protein YndB with AHSA1/START domain